MKIKDTLNKIESNITTVNNIQKQLDTVSWLNDNPQGIRIENINRRHSHLCGDSNSFPYFIRCSYINEENNVILKYIAVSKKYNFNIVSYDFNMESSNLSIVFDVYNIHTKWVYSINYNTVKETCPVIQDLTDYKLDMKPLQVAYSNMFGIKYETIQFF